MKESRKTRVGKKIAVFILCGMICLTGVTMFAGCNTAVPEQTQDTDTENKSARASIWDLLGISGSSDEATSEEEFLEKAEYLKSLIDFYFLEDVDEEDLYEGMYRGLLEALDDPYSVYYSAEEYAAMMEELEGTYCGIGALVSQSAATNEITIVRPFVNGPAYNAGILPGDIVTSIDGQEIFDWDISMAVKYMKGEQGTPVEIEVWRASESAYKDFTVIRDFIEVETVTYEMMEDSIGYISIMEFDEVTTEQFETALNELTNQGMKGLVIDIRDNGGGLLTTVCDMLDLFLDEGLIVYTLDKHDYKEEIHAKKGSIEAVPMAILINGYSASASEIFAGAMQDYGLATIVGTQSFGKGIVQSILPLTDGSAVKLTISTYYTPKGRNIHEVGITPDVEVELAEELKQKVIVSLEEDNQVQAAIEEIKKQMQ